MGDKNVGDKASEVENDVQEKGQAQESEEVRLSRDSFVRTLACVDALLPRSPAVHPWPYCTSTFERREAR